MTDIHTYRVMIEFVGKSQDCGMRFDTYFVSSGDRASIKEAMLFAKARFDAFSDTLTQIAFLSVSRINHPYVDDQGYLEESQRYALYEWKEGSRRFVARGIKDIPKMSDEFHPEEMTRCPVTGTITYDD